MKHPLFQEIPYQDPLPVFAQFANQQGAVFLDSAQERSGCGRYSFIAVDPFWVMTSRTIDPWQMLTEKLSAFSLEMHSELPPFQGGIAGFFSYDLSFYLEKIISKQEDDRHLELAVGFYDVVVAFDHALKRAWIFSSGFPLQELVPRKARAEERLQWMLGCISSSATIKKLSKTAENLKIISNFTRTHYLEAVQRVKDYILAGDIFEANISQCFSATLPESISSWDVYCHLREKNPAPFSAYLFFEDTVIASASPERFLQVIDKQVEARPIKGTRSRGKTKEEDVLLANELMQSEKDRAENMMIVDLMRNDLSKTCEPHSVIVSQLCGLESYPSVHHLVSVIQGKLRERYHALDLLRFAFPGGSITGAPKIRAMEIIAEIEPTRRGPYCGSVGYIGFNGSMDTSIVIRTYVIKNNRVTFQTGGAVTADSNPEEEYEETLTKAKALQETLYDFVN